MTKIFLSCLIFFSSLTLISQIKPENNLAGVSIGLQAKFTSPIIGLNYEFFLPEDNLGIFGVGGIFRYWSFSDELTNKDQITYTNLVLAAQVNYNFNKIAGGKFIPYAGIVAGYNNVTTKYKSFNGSGIIAYDQKYRNGLILWVQGGFRYQFSPKWFGHVRLGLGNLDFTTIEIGADYKF